ncbi:hypothetical protein Poly51_48960 [Rubripirellula tenax]|uniref:Uncharacterized protein n=1 Tax=Rubripirellula tenax TaxID=2528015 RepID=A0A5C6EIU9_9BACT|nr:hypothetical protein [Rubripirellula tenax]TWU48992.1 hypothetical protein Poly51_48960 [Rubripirellula tenax]
MPDATLDFEVGGKVIIDGIAFYLDTVDSTRFYAASPSGIQTDERLDLVVSDAVRVFPLFLRRNPKYYQLVYGRILSVRLIGTYADKPTEYFREHVMQLDWGYVSDFLGQSR